MECYLDNAATTRCSEEAAAMMQQVLLCDYANPSSLHKLGMEAERYINEAKTKIAKTLRVQPQEITFTSGGTESNNFALLGAARANRRAGKHIITTPIEHASVSAPLEALQQEGYEVSVLPVDSDGRVDPQEVASAVRADTILVSVMHVNNEIGAVEPIEEIGAVIKEKNEHTLFHVDAIQSYGKFRLYPSAAHIDLLSVSGHKIHGPKGSGFLYVKDKTKISPILFGGGQQKGLRSGTENVPAIAALGVAADLMYRDFEQNVLRLYALRDAFIEGIKSIEGVTVNGRTDHTYAPHIISVSTKGVRAEVLLHALEERSVYVSSGSACSSNKPSVSKTLRAIGLPQDLLNSTIRFSLSVHTTQEEIDYAVGALRELLPALRRYTRR